MPRWLPRAVVLVLGLYACFQLGSWAFHQLIGLLINVLIAFFLALAVEPAVGRMAARGMRRGAATLLVFLGVLALSTGFVVMLGSMLAGQITQMIDEFPQYLDSVIGWTNGHFHTSLSRLEIQDSLLHSDWLQRYVQNSASGVLDVSTTVLGGLFRLLTIFLFSFYFAADGPRLRRGLCSVLPPARQAEVLRAWEIAVAKTGGYLYSRGLMALVSGVAHYVLLQILGIPYAPVLGVWVGLISQFVPTIGTYLAGALPMLVAFTVNPWYTLWVLVFVVVYQQFENYLLQPKLTSKTVDIHPAVAFGSVIAGTALLGAVGAVIAIPAVATLQAFLSAYVRRYDVVEDPLSRAARPRSRGGDDPGDPDGARAPGGDGGGPANEGALMRRALRGVRSLRRDPVRGTGGRRVDGRAAAPVPQPESEPQPQPQPESEPQSEAGAVPEPPASSLPGPAAAPDRVPGAGLAPGPDRDGDREVGTGGRSG